MLQNMCRGDHVTASFPQAGNLLDDILFQLFICPIRQQILLVDGSPENEPVTEPAFHILRQMPWNTRLNGVEHFKTDFMDVIKQFSHSTVTMENGNYIRLCLFEPVNHFLIYRFQLVAKSFGRNDQAHLGTKVISKP